jgi:sugar phosphate isomerase/epimerase
MAQKAQVPRPRPLSIHQITAMGAGPVGLVKIAADTGCDGVCIFTHLPGSAAKSGFPVVTNADKAAMKSALVEHGVTVSNIEFFPITENAVLADMVPALALGAELGAKRAVCHIHDAVEDRAADSLGQLADLAASLGLNLGLEFMGMTAGCRTIQQAAWFVDRVGRPNLGLAVDMLHLVRTGGTAGDVAALDPRYFSYAQICDGTGLHASDDYLPEALNRVLPGKGDFPIQAILNALPASCPIDVEVPTSNAVDPAEWAAEAVTCSRLMIEQAKVIR